MDPNDTNFFMLMFLHQVINAEIRRDEEDEDADAAGRALDN